MVMVTHCCLKGRCPHQASWSPLRCYSISTWHSHGIVKAGKDCWGHQLQLITQHHCVHHQTRSLRGAGGKRHLNQILNPSAWNLLLGFVNSSAVFFSNESSGNHQEVSLHSQVHQKVGSPKKSKPKPQKVTLSRPWKQLKHPTKRLTKITEKQSKQPKHCMVYAYLL